MNIMSEKQVTFLGRPTAPLTGPEGQGRDWLLLSGRAGLPEWVGWGTHPLALLPPGLEPDLLSF